MTRRELEAENARLRSELAAVRQAVDAGETTADAMRAWVDETCALADQQHKDTVALHEQLRVAIAQRDTLQVQRDFLAGRVKQLEAPP